MARDKFHFEFKKALEGDGWKITDDPLFVKTGKFLVQIDIGAEQLIGAEKMGEKIAVEVKTFGNTSFIAAFYEATGKYIVYRKALRMQSEVRELYLAVPVDIFEKYFDEALVKGVLDDEKIKIVVYNQRDKNIFQWIK